MPLNQESLSPAVAASVKNVQFKAVGENVARKILAIATYDPLKLSVTDDVAVQVLSAADAGDKFGFGSMAHRMAIQTFLGSSGVEMWIAPQSEAGGAVVATGDITFTATSLQAGTVSLYIAGDAVPFSVSSTDDSDAVATKAAAAINADDNLPVTAVVGTPTNKIDITAKTKGTYGNEITLKLNIKAGEVLPDGLTTVITGMASGSGTPDIQTALDALGTGDNSNENFFTDVVHGYLQDTATLDAIANYVGQGDTFLGLYSKTVGRPFRVLTGDTVAGSTGFTNLTALGNGRKLDRANGVIAVPGSANHPSEIAAQAIGHMARINSDVVAQTFVNVILIGIDPGESAERWTADYDNRDNASKAGVSPTLASNGAVLMQNVFTFYHPDNVPSSSNGYRSMRNIAILQNIMFNIKVTFSQPQWQGTYIVGSVANVTNAIDRVKARDIVAVRNELVSLAESFESKGWIYDKSVTIDGLKQPGAVTVNTLNNGFNATLPVILSGEANIINVVTEFDTSIASLL